MSSILQFKKKAEKDIMLLFVTSVFEATGKAESDTFFCCVALIPRK